MQLRGKVALVTGGSRGLGFLLARELRRAGCQVAICGRDEKALQWAWQQLDGDILARPCDVADREQVSALVQAVTERLGAIDLLVNNAGIIEVGPLESMRIEDFERAMDIMFWGQLNTIMAVYPRMIERGRGGTIVNITSIGGRASVPHLLPYSAAKFAATGLSEGLRAELAPHGITVLTVTPGLMRTGSFVNALVRSRQQAEFTWFSLGSALPLISMDAERAAGQILHAIEQGKHDLVLSWPAKLLAAFHGLFPGTTATIMSLVNRVLPAPGRDQPSIGRELQAGPILNLALKLGRDASDRFQPR